MTRVAPAVLVAIPLALAGCGDGGESGSTGGGAGGAGPNPDELRFDTSTYTLEPGEEKRYLCFTTHVSDDADVIATKITPIYGKATHHLLVYEPIVPEPEGAFHCPELVRETWLPLYAGGIQSGSLEAPPGAAFHIKAGQQLLVQLHLLNTSAERITDKATIVLETTKAPNTIPAGLYGMSDHVIDVPAHAHGVDATMGCKIAWDMDVFAIFPHMHQFGTRFSASRGTVAGKNVFYESGWNFDNQPMVPLATHFAAGDDVTVRCTYDNPSGDAVSYGESSLSEMCVFILFYTPFQQLGGCLKTSGAQ